MTRPPVDIDNCLCLPLLSLPHDIGFCQYRYMSKSLTVVDQTVTGACCAPGPQVTLPSQQAGQALCCAPLSQVPLSLEQAEQIAPLLKALADPVRLRLMSLVASREGGEACVCDLTGAFDLSQPTISHHLKVLYEAGLLGREKRGVWVYYRARADALASLGILIGSPR
jgi:ArsR family transcriptional regulator, arsenate/arsenite/antimonite-responsive transcriptional repressor